MKVSVYTPIYLYTPIYYYIISESTFQMSRFHQRLVVITRVSVGVSVWMPELFVIYPIEQIGVPLAF